MPLRRLELSNFKSYRGKQVIDLGDAPFMCIIGPNGAGKSNLMDAISFVLGVRSAQLRSTQLRDLVYRGRKASDEEDMDVDDQAPETDDGDDSDRQTAFVVAVYEDDDGKEWNFKRSINLQGSSNYFINSKSIPWNTYNAQLEKFNVLVKAKNFLVFQGDVEGVASQDSKALAKLIDRISGSLDLAPQYEAAKAAQEKATEASNANFARKRGVVAEVKHFEEQREEFKQWERLRDAKDAAVQRHLLWRLYHITSEITESTKKVEEANGRLTGLRASADRSDKKLRAAKKEQAEASLKVKERESKVKKGEKALEEKKPEIVAVDTQIAHSEKRIVDLTRTMDRVQKDEERQAESLASLEEGAAAINERMTEAAEKQRKKSQTSGKTLSKEELDQYRELRSQANTSAVSERQQLETLRRERKTLTDALASIQDRVQLAESKKAKLQGEVDRLAEREDETSDKVDKLSSERNAIKAELDNAQEERIRIRQKETEINERLHDTYNKLLQAGVDKQESQREARLKETLSSLKRVFPGVHGRVIDLCKPTARKYDTAVMTVLGRHTEAVIVEQEKVAIDCIEYMRTQRAGSATFIPLDTIQVKAVPERLRNFVRGARLAIDCIEYDTNVERAMQYVCGNSMICDNMGVAKEVCYEKAQEVKAVTLDGTVIHRSGLITGGQSSRSNASRFDDEHVERLKRSKENYTAQLQELNKSKPKDKGDEGLLENVARLDALLGLAKDDLNATQLRLTGLRDELKHTDSELKKLSPDHDKKAKAVELSDAKIAKLVDTVNVADDAVFNAFCKKIKVANIRDYEDVQLKMAREENEAMAEYTTQKNRIGHQIEFERKQLESTRERLTTLRKGIKEAEENVKTRQSGKAELEQEVQALEKRLETLKQKLDEANTKFEEVRSKLDEVREAARRTQRDLDRSLKEIAAWNDEIEKSASDRHAIFRKCRLEEIDLPLAKGSLDKVPLLEETAEADDDAMDVDDDGTQRPATVKDYGVKPDFDELDEEAKEDGSEEAGRALEAEVTKMKSDLEKLAPDMKAIERLKDVQVGLQEVEEEAGETRKESKRARDEFQELKKKRCDLFNKAFAHISGCIDRIYKDLTKSRIFTHGGTAVLYNDDAEEPYLGGVRYSAMPPGKHFTEMDQLSGGEKTMAALALLFAIHSFHPAPFFVLDEVDAALDPTNVSKLARYIGAQAAKGVQFLIISLKSALYEHADGLVGVYREQEENSSRTLSLDLRKYDQ